MQTTLSAGRAGGLAARRALSACWHLSAYLLTRFAAARTRQILGDLDDRILEDIGLERTDINGLADRIAESRLRRRP